MLSKCTLLPNIKRQGVAPLTFNVSGHLKKCSGKKTELGNVYNDFLYVDNQATTPMDPRVLDAMLPHLTHLFGNPNSTTHAFGYEAASTFSEAQENVSSLIGCRPDEVVFTSGATESNNTALKGAALYELTKPNPRKQIIVSEIEHKCVLNSARELARIHGFTVKMLPVDGRGVVDLDTLEKWLKETPTLIVSVMAANNEIGTLQPVKKIGELCRKYNSLYHCDAAQCIGKVPLTVRDKILEGMNEDSIIDARYVDLMSMSGHKLYGPKGVGALFIRKDKRADGGRKADIIPIMSGGGQQNGMRSGTIPTPLCVGMGEAAKIARKEFTNALKRQKVGLNKGGDRMRMEEKHDRALERIKKIPRSKINGPLEQYYFNKSKVNEIGSDMEEKGDVPALRIPENLNASFSCIEGESLMMQMRGKVGSGNKAVCVSSGSACTSDSLEPSYVLSAAYRHSKDPAISPELAHSSIRMGFGRFLSDEKIQEGMGSLEKSVAHLRELSPLWEMMEKGIDLRNVAWKEE